MKLGGQNIFFGAKLDLALGAKYDLEGVIVQGFTIT